MAPTLTRGVQGEEGVPRIPSCHNVRQIRHPDWDVNSLVSVHHPQPVDPFCGVCDV